MWENEPSSLRADLQYPPIKLERLNPDFDDYGAQTGLPHPLNSIRLDSDRLSLGLRRRRSAVVYPFHHLITDLTPRGPHPPRTVPSAAPAIHA